MQKGFTTLFIVIILGSLVTGLVIAFSISSVWSIRGNTNLVNSNISKALVNACAEMALETLRLNNNYTGTGNISLNGNSCSYSISNTGGNTRAIVASSTVSGTIRKVNVNTSTFNPISITNWQEVP
ncbi:MAG: hypothetical protein NTV72_02910 [Candidatus Taylorbacteria bacterium]|nr:hypothetical protein [Candidatus Taylorbacteria bacterium]